MTSTAVWIIVAVVVLVVVIIVLMRRPPAADTEPVITDEHARWPDDDSEAQLVERDPELRWFDRIGALPGTLDDDARLRLIGDLGLIHAAWVVPVLQQAYLEERQLSHRRAALMALAGCPYPGAKSTLESAAQSPDEGERAVAIAVLRGETAPKGAIRLDNSLAHSQD